MDFYSIRAKLTLSFETGREWLYSIDDWVIVKHILIQFLLICSVMLTFASVDKILKCDR